MSWLGRKKIAFVPVHRPNAHPPDDPVPDDWANEIRRRVFFDPRPLSKADTSRADMSLRTYINKVSSGRADLDGIVMPMLTIDKQDVRSDTVDPLVGDQLRADGFDAGAIVMLGGPGAGTSDQGRFWARFVMREPLGTWAMELIHVLGDIFDTRPIPGFVDSPHGEGDVTPFDEMAGNLGMHPIAHTKAALGWLDQSAIAQHVGDTINYDLHAIGLAQPPPSSRWAAVQIGSGIPYLMVEARLMVDQFESPSFLPSGSIDPMQPGIRNEGVIVYRIQTSDPRGFSQNQKLPVFLLTPNALGVGQTFTSDTGVQVKVQSAIAGGVSINVTDLAHVVVPDVLYDPIASAEAAIQNAGLVPKSTHTGSWVSSQSPLSGTVVARGSTVTMVLQPGSPP